MHSISESTLDHVGFIVADLEVVSQIFLDLGFTLTTRAEHTRTLPDGRVVSAGSAQRSLMLTHGYVEFMEIVDPAAGHLLASAPTVRHGLHVLAFGTSDARATHTACAAAGLDVGPTVMDWRRAVEEPGASGMAHFRFFGAEWTADDPSFLCWVEHRTPHLLRPPACLAHPNRARALTEVGYGGGHNSVRSWARRLKQGVGITDGSPDPSDPTDNVVQDVLLSGDARIEVRSDRSTRACEPARPAFITLQVEDLDRLCAGADHCGIPCRRTAGRADLDLRAVLGLQWRCVAPREA